MSSSQYYNSSVPAIASNVETNYTFSQLQTAYANGTIGNLVNLDYFENDGSRLVSSGPDVAVLTHNGLLTAAQFIANGQYFYENPGIIIPLIHSAGETFQFENGLTTTIGPGYEQDSLSKSIRSTAHSDPTTFVHDPDILALGTLAAAAYHPYHATTPGYVLQTDPKLSVPPEELGFAAYTYLGDNGEVVIAIRGTSTALNYVSDIGFAVANNSVLSSNIAQIVTLIGDVRVAFPDAPITLTGHSLGGGVAALIASGSGLDAVTFNAPQVGGAPSSYSDIAGSVASVAPHDSDTIPLNNHNNIVNIVGSTDLVHQIPLGGQLGETIVVSTPLSIDPFVNHSIDTLNNTLSNQSTVLNTSENTSNLLFNLHNISAISDTITGFLVHGYVSGATVFIDANGNGALDNGEFQTVSNLNGEFILPNGIGKIISQGGTDVSTMLPIKGSLIAPIGSNTISPITNIIESAGFDNASEILTALGIPSNSSVLGVDPIAAARAGDASTYLASVKVYDTAALIGALGSGTVNDGFAAIATLLKAQSGFVDFGDSTTIKSLVEDRISSLDTVTIAEISNAIAGAIKAIDLAVQGKSGDALITAASAVERVAEGVMTSAFNSAGTDIFQLKAAATGYSGQALTDAIALATSQLASTGSTDHPSSLSFGFALTDAHFDFRSGHDLITGPNGTVTDLTGVTTISFTDGTVKEHAGSALVDDLYYDVTNPDVWAAHLDPTTHYNQYGWHDGRNPNADFSTTGYLAANPDVAAAGINPLIHYDQYGWKEGRDPSANFDNELYLANNPDVKAAGIDPLAHYLAYGQAEGRQAYTAIGKAADLALHPGFDAEYYLLSNTDVAKAAIAAGGDSFAYAYNHYETYGAKEGRAADAYFDTAYYLAHNPDVAAAHIDPLAHYEAYGWKEGRDPSAAFHVSAYEAANPDVAAAHIDPMLHYLQYGAVEGRHLA